MPLLLFKNTYVISHTRRANIVVLQHAISASGTPACHLKSHTWVALWGCLVQFCFVFLKEGEKSDDRTIPARLSCLWSFFTLSDKPEKECDGWKLSLLSQLASLFSLRDNRHCPPTTGCESWLPTESISFDVFDVTLVTLKAIFHMVVTNSARAGGAF